MGNEAATLGFLLGGGDCPHPHHTPKEEGKEEQVPATSCTWPIWGLGIWIPARAVAPIHVAYGDGHPLAGLAWVQDVGMAVIQETHLDFCPGPQDL